MSGLRLPYPARGVVLRPLDHASALAGRVHLLGGLLAITAFVTLNVAHLLDVGIHFAVPVLLISACLCAGFVCIDLLALPSWRRRALTRSEHDHVALRARPRIPAARAHRQLSRLHVDADRLVLTDLTGDRWWLPLEGKQAVRRVAVLVHGSTPSQLHLTTADGVTLLALGWGQWFPDDDTGAARAFADAAGLEYRQGDRREAQVRDPRALTPIADGVRVSPDGAGLFSLVVVSCFAPVTSLVVASTDAPAAELTGTVGAATVALVLTSTVMAVVRVVRDSQLLPPTVAR